MAFTRQYAIPCDDDDIAHCHGLWAGYLEIKTRKRADTHITDMWVPGRLVLA